MKCCRLLSDCININLTKIIIIEKYEKIKDAVMI